MPGYWGTRIPNTPPERIVRHWVDLASAPAAPREPAMPDLVRPDAFIEWGGPADFGEDFRSEAANPSFNTKPKVEQPLQGIWYEEGRRWDDFAVVNPEDSAQEIIARRTVEIAARSKVRDKVTGKFPQLRIQFANAGEDQAPIYKNSKGEEFTPVVLSPLEMITEVNWGGPWGMVLLFWYPEESLSGDQPPLFGLVQGGSMINPIGGDFNQWPADAPDDKHVQYKFQLGTSAYLDEPRSDGAEPDDYPFTTPEDAFHPLYGPGVLALHLVTNNLGPPMYDDVGARWFNPNPHPLVGMGDPAYANVIEEGMRSMRIPGLGSDGLPPEDDPDGPYWRVANLGGGLTYEYAYSDQDEGGTVIIAPNFSTSAILPAPATGVVGGYQIYGYRVWNPAGQGDPAPVSMAGALWNISPVYAEKVLHDPQAMGYRLGWRYGDAEENDQFSGDEKRAAKVLVQIFLRSDFDLMMDWYNAVLEQIDAFTHSNDGGGDGEDSTSEEQPTYSDLDAFMDLFRNPPVQPLLQTEHDVADPTSPYDDHLKMDVQLAPQLGVVFGS